MAELDGSDGQARRRSFSFDDGGNGGVIDPTAIDGGEPDGIDSGSDGSDPGPYGHGYFPDGRPRKRAAQGKRGPRKNTARDKTNLDIKAVEGILLNIHAMLAALTHNPIWAINEGEAHMLGESSCQVLRHYNVPDVAPAVADHINFAIALCAIYGPRLAASKINKNKNDNEATDNAPVATAYPLMPHEIVSPSTH